MTTVLVTGSDGFLGKNLCVALRPRNIPVLTFDVSDPVESLEEKVAQADAIFHLAGVNRPEHVEEFEAVNVGLTRRLAGAVEACGRSPLVVLASSTQAALDNAYGVSKRRAEEVLRDLADRRQACVCVFRLPGVFGKWCRPNYNSVVATFCHNIARGLPVTISDRDRLIDLVYVDDVAAALLATLLDAKALDGYTTRHVTPVYQATLGRLADVIEGFRNSRTSLFVPDLADGLTKRLHATFLSYLDPQCLAHTADVRTDQRGELAELLKSVHCGQLFVSRTRPGVTRGNHYHHTKVERFCVLEGDAVIRLRHVLHDTVESYTVSGRQIQLVDIPPGYTHSIENVGCDDIVVLFWASEPFDAERPDTFACEVLHGEA